MFARLLVVAIVYGVADAAFAEATREQVESLFALSEKVAPSAMRAAREHYDALVEAGTRGRLLDYAFALVLVEQQQWKEADRALEALCKATPNAAPPRQTHVWVQLVRKEFAVALLGLEELAKTLPAVKGTPLTTDHRETARFVGSAIAFLEGPAASPRTDRLTAAAKAKILDKLNDELLPDFEAGAKETHAAFGRLRADTAIAKDEAARQQAEAIAAEREQLDADKSAVNEAAEDLDKRTESQREAAEAELEQLNAQVEELRTEYNRILAAGAPLQAQINAAQAELSALTEVIQNEDGSTTVRYRDPNRGRFLEHLSAQLQAQLTPLQVELNQVNAAVAQLRNTQGALLRKHQIDLQKMFGEGQKLAKVKTRVERMEKNNARAKVTGNSTKSRTLASKIASFGSYEPFPFAREKDRVVSLLK